MVGLTSKILRNTRHILIVTGLSGAGKSSILRILEDIGFEVVDNAPLSLLESMILSSERSMAVGVDVRTSGFNAEHLLALIHTLRMNPQLAVELVYATAEEAVLLRRFTATRRRHPLADHGSVTVTEGIEAETQQLLPLREAAEVVIDTSDLPPPELRLLIEGRYEHRFKNEQKGLTVSFMSFAFPAGLPREADMVFDARFLKNPYYDADLSEKTGLDSDVVAYIKKDLDYEQFINQVEGLLKLVLPRFVTEGKKYATIAVGCSGGRHRSVSIVEDLARRFSQDHKESTPFLGEPIYINIMHRELARKGKGGWRTLSP
ncbi:RNase adapter RapZ [Entomobacter blattae]|nr:RNase adapter RapZ [Entomobacter blattae]